MWRSSRAAVTVAVAALVLVVFGGRAHADLCLPPLFEDGSRLIAPDETRVLWLEPLLRQHEVCWRRPARAGEARVFAYGSSGVFGFPLRAEDTAIAEVNRSLAAAGSPAHVFNLGMLWSFAPKDALILRESERFRPDAIVYVVTLDDYLNSTPTGYAPLDAFLESNPAGVNRIAAAQLPSMAEPFEAYRRLWHGEATAHPVWRGIRQGGSLLRALVRQAALRARGSWFPGFAPEISLAKPSPTYDCGEVQRRVLLWKSRDWSLLPYLAALERERGMPVLVVNWPIAANPIGECFNARYPARDFDEYNASLRAETARLGLRLLDLHDLLAPEDFLDSIHPGRAGQRKVATRLDTGIRQMLANRN